MNKSIVTCLLILAAFVSSCGDGKKEKEIPSLETLKTKIKTWEDSLSKKQAANEQVTSLDRIELINRCLEIYKFYPENELAAASLDKVHMIFSGLNAYRESAAYADTLLEKYPKYKNRALVLESQGSNYDIFIQPRDSAKVRFYYSILLKENPKLSAEKRQGIVDRLKMNALTFDEYMNYQIDKNMATQVVK